MYAISTHIFHSYDSFKIGVNQSTNGGESTYADAFKLARDMQKNYPAEFKLLCSVNQFYQHLDRQNQFNAICIGPLIKYDANTDEILHIRHNVSHNGSRYLCDFDTTPAYFAAKRKFVELLACKNSKYVVTRKMVKGEVVVWDNHRYRIIIYAEMY